LRERKRNKEGQGERGKKNGLPETVAVRRGREEKVREKKRGEGKPEAHD